MGNASYHAKDQRIVIFEYQSFWSPQNSINGFIMLSIEDSENHTENWTENFNSHHSPKKRKTTMYLFHYEKIIWILLAKVEKRNFSWGLL